MKKLNDEVCFYKNGLYYLLFEGVLENELRFFLDEGLFFII